MTEKRRHTTKNQKACKKLPEEITSIAQKIDCVCSETSEWNEDIITALEELIVISQKGIRDINRYKDNYEFKLQQRKEEVAAKILKKKK